MLANAITSHHFVSSLVLCVEPRGVADKALWRRLKLPVSEAEESVDKLTKEGKL